MPHVVGDEGEQPEHRGGGKAVPEDIARAAIAAAEIDGKRDGDRERRRDAGEPRHQQAERAVRAVVREQAGEVADHLEKRGDGIAGEVGRMGHAVRIGEVRFIAGTRGSRRRPDWD